MPEIELKKIKPNRLNPRLEFVKAGLDELADSIKEVGIVEPIIVRPTKEGYEVVVGERRYRAAQQAGLDKVPVIIREFTDDEVIELNLVENIQREDLTDVEKGNCVSELLSRYQDKYPTQASIAKKLGVRPHLVNDWIRTAEIPKSMQRLVAPTDTRRETFSKGKISADVARSISTQIEEPKKQVELARELAERPVSVQKARRIIKEVARKPQKSVEEVVRKIAEEPYELPFRLDHKEPILKGIKTQTSRKSIPDPKVKVGATVHAAVWEPRFADLRVTSIERKKLGDFTEEDAKREGGYTLKEFKEVWKKIHGEWNPDESVYVISFKVEKTVGT